MKSFKDYVEESIGFNELTYDITKQLVKELEKNNVRYQIAKVSPVYDKLRVYDKHGVMYSVVYGEDFKGYGHKQFEMVRMQTRNKLRNEDPDVFTIPEIIAIMKG